MAEDHAAAMAELSQAIAGDILSLPELSDPDWDTYSMVAEVSDHRIAVTGYRYAGSSPPIPSRGPGNLDRFAELRSRTRGRNGEMWDVVLVKIHRDTANLVMNFVSGEDADLWRVNPENIHRLPEALRPRPEDFLPVPVVAPAPQVAGSPVGRDHAPAPLVVEVHADGGIRVTTLEGATGLASLRAMRDWMAEAERSGAPVHLRGDLFAPAAASVVDEVRRLASSLDEQASAPARWPKGYSSLQTAACNGLTDQLTDLLERGASPNVGRGASTPYRLAMAHGHVDALVALRGAGARRPRGLEAPDVLPKGVVFRVVPPAWLWWLLVPFAALAALAVADGVYALAPAFVALPLVGIGAVHLLLGNTRCAIDGPLVARRRGRRWQGPVDLRTLDALGFTPPGTVRMPVLWMLGQRSDGDRPDVYATSAFDAGQRAAMAEIDGLRFVPISAARGFLSPGFERLLSRHVDRTSVIIGAGATDRIWPG